MRVDVVIPIYRPTEKLKTLLHKIANQTYKVGCVFLMHTKDGCDLSWVKEVCSDIPVKEILIDRKAFDYGKTRDLGIQMSDAEVVILMTQDAVPANDKLIENLVNALKKDSEIAVAYARQTVDKDCGEIEAYTRKFNYPPKSRVKSKADVPRLGIKAYFCSNVCAAYKKEIYQELGGFEKRIIFNEDMVFAARAIENGYKVGYEADAIVIHYHDHTPFQLLQRNFDLGVSQACYPEIFECVKSENEGIRLVKKTAKYLIRERKPLKIIELIVKSGCKYMGYQLGKHYRRLPKILVMKLTMNPIYWGGEK